MMHGTVISVTLYLHRNQTHGGVGFHPVVSHTMRFWLWLTTGMVTKEWVAVHRKHHAHVETKDDPHSPQRYGIKRVLFGGAGLYHTEAAKRETLVKYGYGTPDDWVERNVYSKFRWHGIPMGTVLMLAIDLFFFGVAGIAVWAAQMLTIPILGAGVVNGIGHYYGYRNFNTPDASRNFFPVGVIAGGEEFHNNHHEKQWSPKFSHRWWEFDIGWMYIRIFEFFHLSTVKRRSVRVA